MRDRVVFIRVLAEAANVTAVADLMPVEPVGEYAFPQEVTDTARSDAFTSLPDDGDRSPR